MHIIMQCPFFEEEKRAMLEELNELENAEITELLNEQGRTFLYLMGKHPENVSFEIMYKVWAISARHIAEIYKRAIIGRL